jgi:dephospho-CoA kinase
VASDPGRLLVVMIKLVGLTGGIGSGKSTVAQMLRERGIPVLDADAMARQVVEPGQPAHGEIAAAWPDVIAADGTIDRKKLGAIVFSDPASQARLQAITHPRIRAQVAVQAAALAAAGHGLAFLEAALLVETGYYQQLDGLVVVSLDEGAQVGRVMARDACSRDSALARIRAQKPLADKIRVADHVIDNGGSVEATRARLAHILQAIETPSEESHAELGRPTRS